MAAPELVGHPTAPSPSRLLDECEWKGDNPRLPDHLQMRKAAKAALTIGGLLMEGAELASARGAQPR